MVKQDGVAGHKDRKGTALWGVRDALLRVGVTEIYDYDCDQDFFQTGDPNARVAKSKRHSITTKEKKGAHSLGGLHLSFLRTTNTIGLG